MGLWDAVPWAGCGARWHVSRTFSWELCWLCVPFFMKGSLTSFLPIDGWEGRVYALRFRMVQEEAVWPCCDWCVPVCSPVGLWCSQHMLNSTHCAD